MHPGTTLVDATKLWKTPCADNTGNRTKRYAQGGTPLTLQTSNWKTPHGLQGNADGGGGEFHKQVTQWPTPRTITGGPEVRETKVLRGSGAIDLQQAARQWPTARSEDAESCGNHPGATDSLTGAARQWPTPVSNDHKSTVTGNIAKRNSRPLRERAGSFRLGPKTSPRGAKSSPETRKLNPLFVEALMGLPPGWTDYTPLASIAFGLWETESCRWLQHLLTRGSEERLIDAA
jgi:hypothetical protein